MFSVKGQMRVSIWTITSVRERTMLTCLSVYQIPLGLGDLKECDGTYSECGEANRLLASKREGGRGDQADRDKEKSPHSEETAQA